MFFSICTISSASSTTRNCMALPQLESVVGSPCFFLQAHHCYAVCTIFRQAKYKDRAGLRHGCCVESPSLVLRSIGASILRLLRTAYIDIVIKPSWMLHQREEIANVFVPGCRLLRRLCLERNEYSFHFKRGAEFKVFHQRIKILSTGKHLEYECRRHCAPQGQSVGREF